MSRSPLLRPSPFDRSADLAADRRSPHLSGRESEIIAMIGHGYSNQEIAETLVLSINSVKTYIRTAYGKIGVSSRSQAVIWAMARSLLRAQTEAEAGGPPPRHRFVG
ncbi:helix-turn-helix transcriptional regulator [Nocardioides sp. 503]|uniref:response regulator transcription factor n=1 Tax=Nocardioides sp. 503 TaxID=2508326 RepID=UPI00106F934B|nr:helix-turn-helix transcriptional regulator [Nocardioides sp. 503]